MAAVTSFSNHAGADGDGNDLRENIVADGKRKLEEGDEALRVVKKAAADTSHEQALSWNELLITIPKVCLHTRTGEGMWYLDSGCSRHMTGVKTMFASLKLRDGGFVTIDDNTRGKIVGIGTIELSVCTKRYSSSDVEYWKAHYAYFSIGMSPVNLSKVSESGGSSSRLNSGSEDCCVVTPSPPPAPSHISEDDTVLSSYHEYKPVVAMVAVQCIYAAMALSAKAAFTQGISPMVFVVYRQAIAAAALIPTSILSRRGSIAHMSLGCRGFCLVFIAALVGATLNQYLYYQGLKMASSSTAIAMTNLVPAITFLMAALIGLEQVELRSWRSTAKVIGTIICVVGAISMGFFKGPKLFRMKLPTLTAFLHSFSEKWVIGCLFLMGSACCWSLWLIIQVPICKKFLDPLSLSTWMCFLSTFQSALITYFIEPNLIAWRITSVFELLCCLFVGIFGSGVTYFLQSWSIAIKGPLFSASFTPLSTVITTILAFLVLGEELHIGSLLGAVAVMSGLYIFLWGKAKYYDPKGRAKETKNAENATIIFDGQRNNDCEPGMREPLISER